MNGLLRNTNHDKVHTVPEQQIVSIRFELAFIWNHFNRGYASVAMIILISDYNHAGAITIQELVKLFQGTRDVTQLCRNEMP